jgi:hypothetical protein
MSLRGALGAVVAVVLILGTPAAAGPAQPRPLSRVVTIDYTGPCVLALTAPHQFTVRSCPREQIFRPRIDERFASLQIADDSGRPVGISFNLYAEIPPPPTLFCGAERVRVDGVAYVANPALLVGNTDCPYPPTSGTITVTLFRR